MTYDLTPAENEAIAAFKAEHSCKSERIFAVDVQPFVIIIRENGIGHTVLLRCDCGEERNVTDLDAW